MSRESNLCLEDDVVSRERICVSKDYVVLQKTNLSVLMRQFCIEKDCVVFLFPLFFDVYSISRNRQYMFYSIYLLTN